MPNSPSPWPSSRRTNRSSPRSRASKWKKKREEALHRKGFKAAGEVGLLLLLLLQQRRARSSRHAASSCGRETGLCLFPFVAPPSPEHVVPRLSPPTKNRNKTIYVPEFNASLVPVNPIYLTFQSSRREKKRSNAQEKKKEESEKRERSSSSHTCVFFRSTRTTSTGFVS